MEKFGRAQPVRRLEDRRFVTGAGGFIDDIAPEGALFATFVRAEVAHGSFASLDLSDVDEMPGVRLTLTAEGMEAMGIDLAMGYSTVQNLDGTTAASPVRPMLAKGKVRFVGEPVAIIVADTLDQAREAAEAVMIDYDELDAKMDMAPGGATLHDEAPDNEVFHWGLGKREAAEAALAGAAHRVVTRIEDNRVIVNSMEPRGCFAEWDGSRLHLAYGGQGVWGTKANLAKGFGLSPDAVRVTNPDVGGGFGMKGMDYPEYFAVAAAAKSLGQPVRWMSTRTEAMLSDNAGRDLVSTTELAFDEDLKLVGYKVDTICNIGAYNSNFAQFIQTDLFARVLTGVYDVQDVWLEVKGYFTNTCQVDAYRGAGRPEAIFALERSMDNAARVLGVDPWELRKKSFIRGDQFPYATPTGEAYDVGDFPRVLARVAEESDRAGFPARKAASAKAGKLRGLGLCYYIESILGDPAEGAKVEFHEDGTVSLYVGTQSNGQGHETVFAVFLSDQTGIPVEDIRIIQGDSDLIEMGGGTGGSRSVTTQSNATLATVSTMVTSFSAFLAEENGVDAGEIAFDDERFRVPGSNETPSMQEVAALARSKGREDLTVFQERAELPAKSYPNGAHVAEVEIDPDTGVVSLERYTVTDDFGRLINPLLAEGQVHGGVAQGVGQAITERVVYDDQGQLLTATFMDYAMPRAADVPMIGFTTEPVPSLNNPMGMKGCGEAGTVGALAAVANAVADAVADLGVTDVQMPFTPERVWRMLHSARHAAE